MRREEHAARVREFYEPRLAEHGDDHNVVSYRTRESQEGRFAIVADVGNLTEASVLEVGCGVGHLYDWLTGNGYRGDYLGIDLQDEMIARARKRHPSVRFEVADFLAEPGRFEADYVLACGIFHLADRELYEATIEVLYDSCGIAAAFTSYSTWCPEDKKDASFFADPLKTVEFCRDLTPHLILRHEYIPHDFSIYMYRVR
jgi:trans-aconitate methyltransferase